MASGSGPVPVGAAAAAPRADGVETGPVQSAAARLDALIDNWATGSPEGALTELVRVRGLLGVGPIVGDAAPGDDLLAAAATRCDAVTEVLQSAGGSSSEIVMFRQMSHTLRLWLGGWERTSRNAMLRDNAVMLAAALVTGRVQAP